MTQIALYFQCMSAAAQETFSEFSVMLFLRKDVSPKMCFEVTIETNKKMKKSSINMSDP